MTEINKQKTEWEVISHTADYGFRIYGKSLEELVNNSFKALIGTMFSINENAKRSVSETTIKLKAYEPALLIIDLLRELHYMITSDNVFPINLKLVKLSETEVVAYLNYRLITPEDNINVDVKAVTYHKAKIHNMDEVFFMDISYSLESL